MKNASYRGLLLWVGFLISMLIFTFCSGRTTEKKLHDHFVLYYTGHAEELARLSAEKYPPKVTPGVTIIKRDTTVLSGEKIPCPEAKIDTTTGKTETVYVKCPDSKIVRDSVLKHDTIINTALVDALEREAVINSGKLTVSQDKLSDALKTLKNRTLLNIVLGIALSVCVVGWIRK